MLSCPVLNNLTNCIPTVNTVVSDNATVSVLTVVSTHYLVMLTCQQPTNVTTLPMKGGVIPPDAVLVFDILLLDIWSSDDKVQISTISKPANCKRTVVASDYVRYHYNGSLLSGTYFDTRWVPFFVWNFRTIAERFCLIHLHGIWRLHTNGNPAVVCKDPGLNI